MPTSKRHTSTPSRSRRARATALVFARTPGSRPAAVAGLINGVAIGTPLLVGIAVADPAAGAVACLGAYVAAFTNKGGRRVPRTLGLMVAAGINTVAFGAGVLTVKLFPVDLVILAVLVFAATMGPTFGRTSARCGTMPATAFLAGAATTFVGGVGTEVLLVAAGGMWYAAATMVVTPAPRLGRILAVVGALYRQIAELVPIQGEHPPANHADAVAALRRAEEAGAVLAGPGGDEVLAEQVRVLVATAAHLLDSIAALETIGKPDGAVAREYAALAAELRVRLDAVGITLSHRLPPHRRNSETDAALADFASATERLRAGVVAGSVPYQRSARSAQQYRRFIAISQSVDSPAHQAAHLGLRPNTRIPEPGSAVVAPVTAQRVRAALTLTSSTYRHALRATSITAALFAMAAITQLPHGEWAALAALRVLRPQYGATAQRAFQRVIGNLVGGTCAAVTIALIPSPTVLAALLFAIITAGFAVRPVNYAFWVIFGTPLILLIGDLASPGDWDAALGRIAMTLVGSAAALIGSYLILPDSDISKLPAQLDQSVAASAVYLDAGLARLVEPNPSSYVDVESSRRVAENGLATASETLQLARREPRHREMYSAAAMIGVLHELNSRLAALTTLPAGSGTQIPDLPDYRRHAVTLLRNSSTGPVGQTPGVAHADAPLEAVVDRMREYLNALHVRRLSELRAQPDGETLLRAAIRAEQPIVDQLTQIADTVITLADTVDAQAN